MTNKINLYVDDLRDCPSGFVVARTYYEAIHILETNSVGILTLDHDLGEDVDGKELPNGYDLVKYFCEHGLRADKIYIHTDNPVGRQNMYETLLAAQRREFIAEDIEIYHYPITVNRYSGD
ncbi:cyclic-phosphate processing receiver domain-containing protein [Paenibacillus taichungensis]|uniref:cyclic-phosphate processing receiver domain-containing protein n=1 Tax=Paenibacillus taichungensis TaxID=484184 RepID=UPI0039A3BBB2